MPSVSSMTFDGLTSRWTIPSWCARPRPRAICMNTAAASSNGRRPRFKRASRVSPSYSGMARNKLAFAGLADLVNRADVGMIERRRRAGLDQEACLGRRLDAEMRREKLQGHEALEPLVAGLVDEAHAALAEQVEHEVLPDCGEPRQPIGCSRASDVAGATASASRSSGPSSSWAASSDSISARRRSSSRASLVEEARAIARRRTSMAAASIVLHALPALG